MPKFKTGNMYMTTGIGNAIKSNLDYVDELVRCFEMYLTGNWGDLDDYLKQANNEALIMGRRLLGAYETTKGKVYIITDGSRKQTIVIFATELIKINDKDIYIRRVNNE